jgi:hypothetical protein
LKGNVVLECEREKRKEKGEKEPRKDSLEIDNSYSDN